MPQKAQFPSPSSSLHDVVKIFLGFEGGEGAADGVRLACELGVEETDLAWPAVLETCPERVAGVVLFRAISMARLGLPCCCC